jgi:hypothetical protein
MLSPKKKNVDSSGSLCVSRPDTPRSLCERVNAQYITRKDPGPSVDVAPLGMTPGSLSAALLLLVRSHRQHLSSVPPLHTRRRDADLDLDRDRDVEEARRRRKRNDDGSRSGPRVRARIGTGSLLPRQALRLEIICCAAWNTHARCCCRVGVALRP